LNIVGNADVCATVDDVVRLVPLQQRSSVLLVRPKRPDSGGDRNNLKEVATAAGFSETLDLNEAHVMHHTNLLANVTVAGEENQRCSWSSAR